MEEGRSGALPAEENSVLTENRLTPSDMGVAESCAVSCADLGGMKLMGTQEAEFLVEFECTEKSDWQSLMERLYKRWTRNVPPPPAPPPPAAPLSAHPAKKQASRSVQWEVERLRKCVRMPVMGSLLHAHFGVQHDT